MSAVLLDRYDRRLDEFDDVDDFDSVSSRPHHPAGFHRQPSPRSARRRVTAIHRRRRLLAVLIGLGIVLTVARAAAALDRGSLAPTGRLPHVHSVVVQPGDSLWSLAHELAPQRDPRAVVDALVEARGTSAIAPGETVSWLEN